MADPPKVSSNTPKRFKATKVMSTVISTRKIGFWKGALQLAVPPAACTAKATPAKTKNDANTPAP